MTWVFAPTDSSEQSDPPEVNQYVQGMSDLFSPLYVVLEGEQWLAYSCFETVMQRQADNFREDQSGMKRQLSELQSLIRVMDRGLYRHLGAHTSHVHLPTRGLALTLVFPQRKPARSTSSSASGGTSARSSASLVSTIPSASGRSSSPTTSAATSTTLSPSPSSKPTATS
jgi:hypothetical protein